MNPLISLIAAALVLAGEAALAWHCWRNHRDGRPRVRCLGLNVINPRTGHCRYRWCAACRESRVAGAQYALVRAGDLTPEQRAVFLGSIAEMDVPMGGDQ